MTAAAPASADRRPWLRWARTGVLTAGACVLAAHIVWLWNGSFHSQDGPAHLYAASVLRRLLDGDTTLLSQVYAINLEPDPNWITYPVLSALLRANPPRTAELMVVTLLVVGLVGGLFYAITANGRAVSPVALLGMPVAVGWSLHTGLYNFTASAAVMLFIIGYYLRVSDRVSPWRALLLAMLLVLLYFSHPLSLVAAFAALGLIGAAALIADARRERSWRLAGRRLLGLVVMVTPALVLLLIFLQDPGSTRYAVPRDVWQSFVNTALFRWPVQAVTRGDTTWATTVAVATWSAVVALLVRKVARRDWNRWDALFLLPLLTGGGAVLLPDRLSGGTIVQPRMAMFALLTLLLWIGVANAGAPLTAWLATALGVVAVVALAGLLAIRIEPYRRIDAAVAEVLSVTDALEPGKLILGAVSSRAPNLSPVIPMVHITDLVALESGTIAISTLDAGSGYGPIRYRPRFDPVPALRGLARNRTQGRDVEPEAWANLADRYTDVTGRTFDFLLLVGYDLRPVEIQRYEAAGFRVLRHSAPSGLVWLFDVAPVAPDRQAAK